MTSVRMLVVDNGSLSVRQLRRKFELLGADTEQVHCADVPDRLDSRFDGIVLSGTKVRAYDTDFYRRLTDLVLGCAVPVLGICGGMQLIGTTLGAELVPGRSRVGGHKVRLDMAEPIFARARPTVSLFQRHTLYLREPPAGFSVIGRSDDAPVEFFRSADGRIFGSQAHLEFRADGQDILDGFVQLCDQRGNLR